MTQRMWPRCARSFYEIACFDPIITPTLTALGASAATASTVSTVATTAAVAASAVAGVAGAIQQGQAAKQTANYNAQVSRNNAIGTEQAAAAESDRKSLETRHLLASGVAAAGASGVDPNSGSPLEVVADLAGQAKLDEELARWQARERAKGFGNQAALDTYTGRAATRAGTINAGASLLQGMGRAVSLGRGL